MLFFNQKAFIFKFWKLLVAINNWSFKNIFFCYYYYFVKTTSTSVKHANAFRKQKSRKVCFMHINYAFTSNFSSGSSTQIRHLSLKSLLPNTEQYMTYEGSTTHPGCWESVVWVILNKPIYITKQEVRMVIIKAQ